jgi:hypothetical protein
VVLRAANTNRSIASGNRTFAIGFAAGVLPKLNNQLSYQNQEHPMKKQRLIILFIAVLALSACARPTIETQPTIATPPSIQTSKTPLELVMEAVNNTKNIGTFTIQYGTVTITGEDTVKKLHIQPLSPEQPFDWDALYAAVPDFPTNEHLLADFCSGPLQAVPSNTGTIRYERTNLTQSEMDTLMYGNISEACDFLKVIGTAAIEVDADNRFTRLEFILEHYGADDTLQRTVTIVLSITFPS